MVLLPTPRVAAIVLVCALPLIAFVLPTTIPARLAAEVRLNEPAEGRAPSPAGEGASEAPLPGQDELIRRLEATERQLQKLQAELSSRASPDPDLTSGASLDTKGVNQTSDPVAGEAPPTAADFRTLSKQFQDLKAGLEQRKYPTVELHGVFQVDTGWVHQTQTSRETVGDIQDGSSFRRARLSANGKVVDNMSYFVQMDFGFFGRPTFTDVWMELNAVPLLGNVRVGQWKQPFGLEVATSFRYTMFAERSLLFQSFAPFRHIALGFYDWAEDESATWAGSVYRSGNDQFGGSVGDNGNWAFTGRATWLPYANAEGDDYLNLGLGYNYVAYKDRTARFRTIPEYFIGESVPASIGSSGQGVPGSVNGTPFFVDTGGFAANHQNLLGTELLWVSGPLTVMSEANYNFVAQTNGPAVGFPGVVAQAGYFLTGEHRPFNKKLAQIDRIQVREKVGYDAQTGCWGWGAWEVAARYSYLNLNDANIAGGRLQDGTLGVNWYLNNFAKVQFNYIRAFLDNPSKGSSTTDIFGVRGQLDF
jgi:phosphate-selective porin OprO/OprP